jgi:hypothetical protein
MLPLVFELDLWSDDFVSKLRFLVLPCRSSFLQFSLGSLISCVGAVDFALSLNYFLFPVFSVSSGASREGFYLGGASARPTNTPRTQIACARTQGLHQG